MFFLNKEVEIFKDDPIECRNRDPYDHFPPEPFNPDEFPLNVARVAQKNLLVGMKDGSIVFDFDTAQQATDAFLIQQGIDRISTMTLFAQGDIPWAISASDN